tara:strand:+ start:271 stop:585 length:315 start_codon:yes stop_codon:yes gene_type:complete
VTFTAQKRQRPADNNAQGKPRSTVTVYAYHLTVLKVKILNFCQVPSQGDANQSWCDSYNPVFGKASLNIKWQTGRHNEKTCRPCDHNRGCLRPRAGAVIPDAIN